jgi:cyclophilin family peptidyl-prolyl cis-trans isomerase
MVLGLLGSAAAAVFLVRNIPPPEEPAAPADNPRVRVVMEDGGEFVIELYPQYAPVTVANFLALAESGFYNGLTFHRIIDGYMALGGAPDAAGLGGSGEEIYGEFAANGWEANTLSHTRGVVSMARRRDDPNSASSQFFILFTNAYTHLDGQYAAFGRVIEGMEMVDAFQNVARAVGADGNLSSPVTPVVIGEMLVIGGIPGG